MSSDSQLTEKAFFDVHTTGCGFLNRIREVIPKDKRDAFLACTIRALTGTSAHPVYRYLDVRIVGTKAQEVIRNHAAAVAAGRPVLLSFRLGDVYPDVFVRTKGIHNGMADACLKGRLLHATVLETSDMPQMMHHTLKTYGVGYIKHIAPSQQDPLRRFCSITMLSGAVQQPEYRYIDATVTDPALVVLLDKWADAIQAKRKVLISFQLNDLQASFFISCRSDNAGEQVPVLKSTLSAIGTIKVDGEKVYGAPSRGSSKPPEASPQKSTADVKQVITGRFRIV
ncbi:DUF3577 domain-containing protein [Lelliottia amnigena]|uniref:DUF3577 domain-containing protein n=1 Tax=Lelliottia amnigena TaxID=61646 RepID=UPI004055B302